MFRLNEREKSVRLTGVSIAFCLGGVMVWVVLLAGCNKRRLAPEISYDDAQVERIQMEVEKLDW